MNQTAASNPQKQFAWVTTNSVQLTGELVIPNAAEGIVLFAHSRGCDRISHCNRYIAHLLRQAGLATLLINLLTAREEEIDLRSRQLRFNVPLIANRLVAITDWLTQQQKTSHLKIGYFGDDAGSAGAVVAAIERPSRVSAIVSRSGRLDLVRTPLSQLLTPTLLIVGATDFSTIGINQDALRDIAAENKRLEMIPNASHQFQETGAIEEITQLASQWFTQHLTAKRFSSPSLRELLLFES